MKTKIVIEYEDKSDLMNVLQEIRAEIQKGYTKSSGVLPAIRQPQPVPMPCPPMPAGYPQPPQQPYDCHSDERVIKELAPTYYEYALEED